MDKICLINQPAGIGDVFYIQGIVDYYAGLGFQVILPLIPEVYAQVKNNLKTRAILVDKSREYKHLSDNDQSKFGEDYVYLNLHKCPLNGKRIMESKYAESRIYDRHNDWLKSFDWTRSEKYENFVYQKICGLEIGEKYAFRNCLYGTQPDVKSLEIEINSGIRIIDARIIRGITVFDWAKVIENAEEIWMVDSSMNFILEKLSIKASRLELFSRRGSGNFKEVDYLFNLPWNYN